VLFTGRYPNDLYRLLVGMARWNLRVLAYVILLPLQYPPLRLDQGDSEPDPEPEDPPGDPAIGVPGGSHSVWCRSALVRPARHRQPGVKRMRHASAHPPGGDVMLFVAVVAILLVMAMLALAGPLLEDIAEWVRKVSRRRGKAVRPPQDERVPQHSVRR
jgi:hypothetical protein